jgi:hypothetical protein
VRRPTREAALCACAAAGPAAWFALLCVAWAITPAAHEARPTGVLLGLHALALAAAVIPGAVASRALRRARRGAAGDPLTERARFWASAAVALSVASVLLVLANALPLFLLTPGAEP